MSHKPDCKCPICDPSSRYTGRLSEDEPTVSYTVRLPKSLRDACREAGSARVREILAEALAKESSV